MASRKKSKGQARKAKKEANNDVRNEVQMIEAAKSRSVAIVRASQSKSVAVIAVKTKDKTETIVFPFIMQGITKKFHDCLFSEWNEDINNSYCCSATLGMLRTYRGVPDVWRDADETIRSAMRDVLLRWGQWIILDSVSNHDPSVRIKVAGGIAAAVHMLENYDHSTNTVKNCFTLKNDDIFLGCERLVVQFFAKRLDCPELKKVYKRVKLKKQKTGVCHTCHKRFSRCDLFYCTACGGQQYCSEECQKLNYSEHRQICGKLGRRLTQKWPINLM